MLYIVPTPIGNIEDITLRALRVLKEVNFVLAEDTRTTGKLLSYYEIKAQLRSFHAFNEHKVVNSFVEMLQAGEDLALVSDAGTPGISDPGFLLIRAAIEAEVEITCLPGATAMIPALVMSGFPCDKFYYEGFLPHKKGRKTRWEYLSTLPCTFVLYESPHRIVKCIKEVVTYCGPDRLVNVSREVSKMYEENIRGRAEDVLNKLESKPIKGEIVVSIQGLIK